MEVVYGLAAYLVVASLIGLIPATLAKSKGRSFAGWWAASVLLAGIFTVIPVMLLPTYRCQECREVVHPDAKVCWHCGAQVKRAASRPGVARVVRPRTRDEARQDLITGAVLIGAVVLTALPMVCWAAFEGLPTPGAVGLSAGLAVTSLALAAAGLINPWRAYKSANPAADQ